MSPYFNYFIRCPLSSPLHTHPGDVTDSCGKLSASERRVVESEAVAIVATCGVPTEYVCTTMVFASESVTRDK